MPNVEKVTVALTPELAGMVRRAVDGGDYASASEVVREALRLWKLEQAERSRAVEEVRRLWREGVESGDAVDGRKSFARLRAKYEAMAAEAETVTAESGA